MTGRGALKGRGAIFSITFRETSAGKSANSALMRRANISPDAADPTIECGLHGHGGTVDPLYSVGTRVRLRADLDKVGLVTARFAYEGGFTYEVFFSANQILQVNQDALEGATEAKSILVRPR